MIETEKKKNITDLILTEYEKKCSEISDINELLPTLLQFSRDCKIITEMGVRTVVSTWAFLASFPEKLVCYDLCRHPNIGLVESYANNVGVDFHFTESDVLKVEIEETDMLFIDTFHSAEQLRRELFLHSGKVRKYLAFHDTTTFWEHAEPSYGIAGLNQVNCGEGLRYAIEPFLVSHPEWEVACKLENNNGLMILRKVSR
jgi:hypothetical protein